MCIADCKYDVVREAARTRGWKLVDEDPETGTRRCHVYWVDVPAIVERMQQLHRWQRINHFPGMSNIARKGRLAQNLDRMRRSFPQEFGFYPRTWVLPAEWGGFKAEFDAGGKSTRTFIVKPDSGCQGRGIFLTQDLERVASMESQVAQLYVRKPLLIEGLKFDLRVYVLVTSVIPLRMYAFKDGLARFCTEEYIRPASDNLGERCMHLTNYAVNKGSDNFVANDSADRDGLGSKRSLRWLLEWVAKERGQERADALWRRMCGACVKTLISILPTLSREYIQTFGPDKGVGDATTQPSGRARDSVDSAVRDDRGKEALGGFPREGGIGGGCQYPPSGDNPASELRRDVSNESTNSDRTEPQAAAERVEQQEPGESSGTPNGDGQNGGVVGGSRCVEILGFDFMIDAALKPWLIEVNHLPSFATDSPLDLRIKSQIVATTLAVLRAKADDKKTYEESSKRDAQNRLYTTDNLATGSLPKEVERKEAEAIVAKIRKQVSRSF